MRILVEAVNKTRYNDVRKAAMKFLKSSINELIKEKLIQAEKISISVAIVGQDAIRSLNRKYRKRDEVTDVLSFRYDDSTQMLGGEIVISPAFIEKCSKEDGKTFADEFNKNLAHGLLHIVGFQHSEEMFNLQKKIAKK